MPRLTDQSKKGPVGPEETPEPTGLSTCQPCGSLPALSSLSSSLSLEFSSRDSGGQSLVQLVLELRSTYRTAC